MRFLCVGNADNVGIRVYTWMKKRKLDVTLYRVVADEDKFRGNPYFYLSKSEVDEDPKIFSIHDPMIKIRFISLLGGREIREINKNFDAVLITGGLHALLYSRKIKLPKIFIHVGYEIHYHAARCRGFPEIKLLLSSIRDTLREYFYCNLTRSSLSKVTKILDWFPPTVSVNKSLGFGDKIIYMSFGEDVKKNREIVQRPFLSKLNNDTKKAKRVFLWFSRLNFSDPKAASYKGPELFISSLEHYIKQMKNDRLIVYMGKHGIEVNQFLKYISDSPVFRLIRWVDHLSYPDLITYLSIKNAVLFTEFGEVNSGISGLGRDGYSIGVPMVNSNTDEMMRKQYTVPGERYFASNINEITKIMNLFLEMDSKEYEICRKKTMDYGNKFIDTSFFLDRLLFEFKKIAPMNNAKT